ncbi:hypothetical protein [Gloeocapsopsis sp. IPPAS B-1203]|uniref:slr1601 family putative cell division protein n=1 Tax=Gloeocapsopsis sp. IPPAS B-1203 TaxID=2049454 RepID=UPI000C17E51E|nr:hypothetical protein [Gloeocapsopsis sp. IPPAS B-1203]PIG90510.1 hypothetical protein CSQ79_26235 [Gloeocapsopsis sp. IPPAS B-1203]
MNAIHSIPPLKPEEPRRIARKRKNRRHPYRTTAIQTTAKIAVNLVLLVATGSTIAKLVPYYLSQQHQLKEIKSEVESAQGRVEQLRTDFNRYFDPQQAKSVMQEQSHRFEPGQRPLILVK